MFIGKSVLKRVSTGAVVGEWPGLMRAPAEAAGRLVGPARRALQDNEGDHVVEHQLACYYRVSVRGEHRDAPADGSLVLEYDVWRTKGLADSGAPPDWSNTHTFVGFPKGWEARTAFEKAAWVQAQVEDAIRDASLRGAEGDERDGRARRRVRALNDAAMAALDGAAVERTA